jgi:predicted PurR-regulated permease PerM
MQVNQQNNSAKQSKQPFSLGMIILLISVAFTFGFVFVKVKSIAFPFVFAFVFAYLFSPLVQRLSLYKIPQGFSSFWIVSLFFGLLTIFVILLTPIVIYKIGLIVKKAPFVISHIQQNIIPRVILLLSKYFTIDESLFVLDQKIANNFSSHLKYFSENILKIILQSTSSAAFLITSLLITPILCFYLLVSFNGLSKNFISIIPQKYKKNILGLQNEVRNGIKSYIKGQCLVSFFLSMYYAIALFIIDLNGSIILGILTGVLSIVPYFGVFICSLIGVVISLYQFGYGLKPLIVFVIFISGQIIDGSFITPNIIGKKIGINPAIIILGFLICGTLFGFWGVLLAVPITLIVYILIKFFVVNIYKKSQFYKD